MITPNYLFGVSKYLTNNYKKIEQGVLVNSLQTNLKTGAPCLIFSNGKDPTENIENIGLFTKTKKASKYFLFPFSFGSKMKPRATVSNTDASNTVVKTIRETNFLDTIKSIEAPKISAHEFKNALEYTQSKGPVVLTIDNNTQLKDDLYSTVCELLKVFRVNSILYSNFNSIPSALPGETPLLAITLANIDCCIPIFNPEKVDGIILNIAIIYPKRSEKDDRLRACLEMSLLFSKYRENILEIDGSGLNFRCYEDSAIKSMIKDTWSYLEIVGKAGKDKAKGDMKSSKAAPLPPKMAINDSKQYVNTSRSWASTTSASTTTNY